MTIIISCFTWNWEVCNLRPACISASHSHPICYNSSNSSVFNKLKLILQTKLKLVIIFQLDLTSSAIAEGSRDAQVSRNLCNYETFHLNKDCNQQMTLKVCTPEVITISAFRQAIYHFLFVACCYLSLIHIWRCRRSYACRSRWSPYH